VCSSSRTAIASRLWCYSLDAGSWRPEAKVTDARISRTQLTVGLHAAIVRRGFMFWPRLAVATSAARLFVVADAYHVRGAEQWRDDTQSRRPNGDGDIVDCGCLLGEVLKWRWTTKQALMRVHTVRRGRARAGRGT